MENEQEKNAPEEACEKCELELLIEEWEKNKEKNWAKLKRELKLFEYREI